jgi:redox-sensitive bicupin YhaK (pirin superfamily)
MKTTETSIVKRAAESRGKAELGWLQSRHTFSFGQYFDPDHMGFRSLRVLNDDIVAPARGFGAHPHRDAEIFSYVIEGELEHRDSLGNGSVIKAGDLQYISAGSGVTHSEFNPSKTNPVHFLQIWLMPNEAGGKPRYAEKSLGEKAKANALTLLFAGTARDGAVEIRQDAEIYFGRADADRSLNVPVAEDRHVWIHLIKGAITVAGETLEPGDGLALSNTGDLEIRASDASEFLLFNLP